jgi:hypothetical protein
MNHVHLSSEGKAVSRVEARRASITWTQALRVGAIIVALAAVLLGARELHLTRVAVEELPAKVDGVSGRLDAMMNTAGKSPHASCPAHDGKPAVDLGQPFDCANKDDGQCVKTPSGESLTIGVAEFRCKAGRL